MITAKIMPSITTSDKIIVSLFSGSGWLGFAKFMDEDSLDFRLTCRDLSSAHEFDDYNQVDSFVLSLQNLGLKDITQKWEFNNQELAGL